MSKPGITIIEDTPGTGAAISKTDRVRILYDIQLNRGEFLIQDEWHSFALDDRNIVAGLRYGIEGMREGGTRTFKASPHLCYRDAKLDRIPQNAVLIVTVKKLQRL